jgi:hypothetical protein
MLFTRQPSDHDPSISASQVAQIVCVNHCAQSDSCNEFFIYLLVWELSAKDV